jgi:acyl carrier protein
VEPSVKSIIRRYIVDARLSGDERGLDDTTDLLESGILDSFAVLSLVAYLEETFRVQLDPVDINPVTFSTVDAIAELLRRKTVT